MEDTLVSSFHILSFLKTQCGRNPDYTVNKIIQSYNLYSNRCNEIVRCNLCTPAGVAVRYCKDCCCYIDKLCYGFHGKMKHLIKHETLVFTQGNFSLLDFVPKMFCGKTGHSEFELDTYCANCSKMVCKRCIKHHNKRNHYLNSLSDLYRVLNVVFETKLALQRAYECLPHQSDYTRKKVVLSTIVRWIDRTFDVNCTDISQSSDPSDVIEILQREMEERRGFHLSPTTYSRHYVSCKSVLEKMKQIQSDLDNISEFRNTKKCTERRQMENGREIAREGHFFSYAPYRTTAGRINQPEEDVNDESSSLSSVDSSGSFQEINGSTAISRGYDNTLPANEHQDMIVRQPEINSDSHDKSVEEEIGILQVAQEDFSFSSFQDLHENSQNRFWNII